MISSRWRGMRLLHRAVVGGAEAAVSLVPWQVDSSRRHWKIKLAALQPVTDNVSLRMQFATDAAGTVFDATLYAYATESLLEAAAPAPSYAGSASTTSFGLTGGENIGNNATETSDWEIDLVAIAGDSARHPRARWVGVGANPSTQCVLHRGSGRRAAAQDVTGVRVFASAGNITCYLELWG